MIGELDNRQPGFKLLPLPIDGAGNESYNRRFHWARYRGINENV